MAEVTIVFWRDIPAQVIVGKGRRAAKKPLPERFEQAIDRCAMKVGARDTDAYLAEWRKAAPYEVEGSDEAVAEIRAGRAQQQAMQQMAAMAKPMADAAGAYRTMAETVPQEGSAMDSLSAALGGPLAGGG